MLLPDTLMPSLCFLMTQKEQLKVLLSAKEREEGTRALETVKVQLRSTLVSDLMRFCFEAESQVNKGSYL